MLLIHCLETLFLAGAGSIGNDNPCDVFRMAKSAICPTPVDLLMVSLHIVGICACTVGRFRLAGVSQRHSQIRLCC